MSEHERSFEVNVPADEAFRFLSSLDNIPTFVPHIKELKEDHGEEIFGRAELKGRSWEVSGFFRASEEDRRIDWGSDGTPDYRGFMEIQPAGEHRCRIRLHISMRSAASEVPPPHPGLAGDRIEHTMGTVVDSIKRLLEKEHAGQLVGEG